jgi:hypothetical protein
MEENLTSRNTYWASKKMMGKNSFIRTAEMFSSKFANAKKRLDAPALRGQTP